MAHALPLALILSLAACADNPADGIPKAEVSEDGSTSADAAREAAEALESGDIIPEGSAAVEIDEESDLGDMDYLDTPGAGTAGDIGYMESSAEGSAEDIGYMDAPGEAGGEDPLPGGGVSGEAGDEADVADAGADDQAGARVFVIHPGNSKIEFEGSKVTRSHQGGFNSFSGEIQLPGETPEGASLSVTIQTESIWTDEDQLTGHLKSADFFDVANHPEASFMLTGASPTENGYDLTGDLSLHGVTRTVTFPASISINENSITATSEFVIDRYDFGIEYPGMADDLIRNEVVIRLSINADAA